MSFPPSTRWEPRLTRITRNLRPSALYNNYFVNDKNPSINNWYNFKVDYNISAEATVDVLRNDH